MVYLLAKNDVIPLNGQSQGILFILVVGAATDYGLLLVSRYREELTRVESTWTAIKVAWRACLEPIAASAGTVIIGLLCLLLSDLNSNRSLGPVGAIGIASAFVAAMTLLPALLMAGRWLFWPRIPRVVEHDGEAHAISASKHGIWERISVAVARHPRRIWAITAAGAGHRLPVRADAEGLRHRADRRLPHRGRFDRRPAGAVRPLPRRLRQPGGDHRAGGRRRSGGQHASPASTASPVSRPS